jgi:hypothetical protein
MHFDWKMIARTAAQMAASRVPAAPAIEGAVEGAIDSKTGEERTAHSIEAGLAALEAEGELAGKNYATPRVELAVHRMHDAVEELVAALAEAHHAQ